MTKLTEGDVIGQQIKSVRTCYRQLGSRTQVEDIFLVLDSGLILELLPDGIRVADANRGFTRATLAQNGEDCLGRTITMVVTDENFYPAASIDDERRNPPYDDVYIILDGEIWIANRFFENGENSLTVETLDELYELSDHYYSYWDRNEVSLRNLRTVRNKHDN